MRRTRASIAVTMESDKYILFDAGHDLKTQLESNGITPRPDVVGKTKRESRIDSIFLTHGHADHTVGLAEFCTGKSFGLPVYGPQDLVEFLFGTDDEPNYFGALGRLARDYVKPVPLAKEVSVTRLGAVQVKGFEVPHTQVLEDGRRYPSSTYAYEIVQGGKRVVYAPDLGRLDEWLLKYLNGVDVFIMDATFWWNDELKRISGIPVTSYQLGHVPQAEAVNILEDLNIGRVIYTHFNHTNPVIKDGSERAFVEEKGQEIAYDGMKILV